MLDLGTNTAYQAGFSILSISIISLSVDGYTFLNIFLWGFFWRGGPLLGKIN